MKEIIVYFCACLLLTACSQFPTVALQSNERITDSDSEFPTGDLTTIEAQAKHLRETGIAYYQRGECSRAINPLEASFLLSPETHEFRSKYLLYYCYLSMGDYKKALTVAEYLIHAHPYQSLSYLQVGIAQLWLGKPEAAIHSLTRALDFDSHSPKVHFYLGVAYGILKSKPAQEREFKEAEKEYLQTLEKNPKDLSTNFDLAALWLYWNHSLEKVPPLLAIAKAELKNETPEETEHYRRFHLPLTEGILWYRNGDAARALPSLLTAFAQVPAGSQADLAEVYYYLGQSHRVIGNLESAKILLEQSISIDPKGPYCEESRKTIQGIKG